MSLLVAEGEAPRLAPGRALDRATRAALDRAGAPAPPRLSPPVAGGHERLPPPAARARPDRPAEAADSPWPELLEPGHDRAATRFWPDLLETDPRATLGGDDLDIEAPLSALERRRRIDREQRGA